MQTCNKCHMELGDESFSMRKETGRLRTSCRSCRSAQQSEYHALNREALNAKLLRRYYDNKDRILAERKRHRDTHLDDYKNRALRRTYGITLSEYREMLRSQGNACAICGAQRPGGQGNFHVDHDHATGVIRGLLCHHCNVGLGHFKDDAERLAKAVSYLSCRQAGNAATSA